MPPKTSLNVQTFPRPPLLERTPRRLVVKYKGQPVAETSSAYWVLETHHAPTYYLPPSSLAPGLNLTRTPKRTFCEWKGWATYHSLRVDNEEIKDRVWSYEAPTPTFQGLKGYLSFYAGPWECYVDGEKVEPQPGDFYGGWTTSELTGLIKGDAATRWM